METKTKQIIDAIRAQAGKAQFVSLTYRAKSSGELARYTAILGANYHNLIEKSKLALELTPETEIVALGIDSSIAAQAKADVLTSFAKTLAAHANGEQNADYTKRGQYSPLGNGLNLNTTDFSIQLFTLVQSKVVIEPGEHKKVNSKPLTIAKNKITKMLPIGKFREFAVDAGNFQNVRLQGETLVLE